MALTPREQIASATMIATHDVVTNLTRAKSAMENLIHEMSDVTALITAEGRIIWGNKATAVWLGVDHDVLHEHSFATLFDLESWQDFQHHLRAVTSQMTETEEFTSVLCKDGRKSDVLWTLKPFRAISARRGLLVLVTGHDITEILQTRSERAKLEAELETAQILQQRFLPPPDIQTKHLSIGSYYTPADQCSGDWWGYFDLGEERELVCIADVTGHGAASALVTAMTQAITMSFVQRNQGKDISPAELLSEINAIVFQTFKGDMYMTVFAFLYDAKASRLRGSNAAHNFPMRLKSLEGGGVGLEAVVVTGNPVGHEAGSQYKDIELETNKGEKIILFTDGITEGRNPQMKMYGAGAFRRSVQRHGAPSAQNMRDKLIEDARQFYGPQPLADDITLVVFELL